MRVDQRREILYACVLGAVVALTAALHGWQADRAARRHLDGLVAELGGALADAAAASVRTTITARETLEKELRASLRVKAGFLGESERVGPGVLQRFALAAGLRHVLVFDPDGKLVARATDLPDPEGDATDQLDLALENAARRLVAEAQGDYLVREWSVPEAGLPPSLAVACGLPGGFGAVLVQSADVFSRAKVASRPDRLAARLERESRLVYVRLGRDVGAPPADDAVRPFERPIDGHGDLRIGVDVTPARDALAVQRRSMVLTGLLLVLVAAGATYGLLRLQRVRADLRRKVERDERLASLGRLAANVAHEVRNPLNAISVAAQRIARSADGDVRALAGVMQDEIERLDRTVTQVLEAARRRDPRFADVRGAELVETLAALARPEAEARGIRLEAEAVAEGLVFEADADLLLGAAWNLLRNAFAQSPDGGRVQLALRAHGERVHLAVADEGSGIAPERRERLFEPFESGRPGGSGLGLSLALSAAEAHRGTIDYRDRASGGTEFTLTIPRKGSAR